MRRDRLTGDSQLAVGVNVNMWMVVCLCVLDRQHAQAESDNRNQLNHQLLYGLRWADCGWASLTELMLMMYSSCVCVSSCSFINMLHEDVTRSRLCKVVTLNHNKGMGSGNMLSVSNLSFLHFIAWVTFVFSGKSQLICCFFSHRMSILGRNGNITFFVCNTATKNLNPPQKPTTLIVKTPV